MSPPEPSGVLALASPESTGGRSRVRVAVRLLVAAVCAACASPATGSAMRLSGGLFGREARIVVRGLDPETARETLAAAWDRLQSSQRLTDPLGGAESALAALNAEAGRGPRTVDPLLLELLRRSLTFCYWSEGLHGPLGGRLYSLWGLRSPTPGIPSPSSIAEAVPAGCENLQLDLEHGTASLAAGSRLDLWGFDLGFAVDQAVEELEARGVTDFLVQVGEVSRARGGGHSGRGWRAVLEPRLAAEPATSELLLRDQALGVASAHYPLRVPGIDLAPYLDQNTGRTVEGVVATVAVTELALDAQALAATMFLAGARRGVFLLGSLTPRPAVLWLLGRGTGEPLLMDYHWYDADRR